jgi:predicted NUDIX family NTP pyrophosphohydrolase
MKKSAGILLCRSNNGTPEVMLVHPGGPFWAKKDEGAWSVPKGEFEDGEEPLQAAIREFEEETGVRLPGSGKFITLTPLKQKSGKMVFVWALEFDMETSKLESNTFELEWPPRSGKKIAVPEIDRAQWFGFDEARVKIIPGQKGFLDEVWSFVIGH